MSLRAYQEEQMPDVHAAFQEHLKSAQGHQYRTASVQPFSDQFDFEYGGVKFDATRPIDPYAFGVDVCVVDRLKVEAMPPEDFRELLGLSNHKILEFMALPTEDRLDRIEGIIAKLHRLRHAKSILNGEIIPMTPTIFVTSNQSEWLKTMSAEDAKAASIRMYETGSFEGEGAGQ